MFYSVDDKANMRNHACTVITHGHHTDIVLKIYSNRTLLIITHFKKFGSLISVNRSESLFHSQNNNIYSTKVLFGKDDVEVVAAVRYIAEQINVDRPLLVSISLKDYEPDTLKTIIDAINTLKAW